MRKRGKHVFDEEPSSGRREGTASGAGRSPRDCEYAHPSGVSFCFYT